VKPESAYVYVIGTPGLQAVKIGWTVNVSGRLKALQTGSPFPLMALWQHLLPDAPTVEANLHQQFRAYRVRGEWFDLGPDAARIVRDACRRLVPDALSALPGEPGMNRRPRGAGRALLALRAADGKPLTAQQVATEAGVTYGSARVLLSRLVKDGRVKTVARNSYVAAELSGDGET
jgi:hypothetical protein